MEKNRKRKQTLFVLTIIVSFGAIYTYNILTPYLSDDLLFDQSIYHSFGDIFREEYKQYMNWNGRSVLQIILKIFMLIPKSVFNFCNSICYVGTMLLIYLNVKGKKKYDVFLYLLINLLVWVFCVDFSQTILWLAGACNYLWGIFIILSFITFYRYLLEKKDGVKYKIPAAAGLFLLGVLAGWGNENTSGGMILIILLLTVQSFMEEKKINKLMYSGIAGAFLGFGFLLLAPGNSVRSQMVKAEESYTGLAAYVSRGLKVLKAVDEYLLIYLIILCLLGAYFYYEKCYKLNEFGEPAIFTFAGLATAGVLIFTPEPMPRAYFGANIYLMMAALWMIEKIREEDRLLISLKTGGILAGALAMFFVYVEEGANLVRILREVNIREAYILEQRAKGESDLYLPALRPEFESRYSMAHLSDISDEEGNWNNDIFRNAYLLDKIWVLSWEEWEAQMENGGTE